VVEGRNLIVTERFLGWDVDVRSDARVAAKELLQGKVDVLSTFGFTAADILKQSTREVPIVFGYVNDPVATGLVDSLARPGGNITGVTRQGVDVIEKRLDLLKTTVPGLRRVGVLVYESLQRTPFVVDELKGAASRMGLEPQLVEVDSSNLAAAVSALKTGRVQAIMPILGLNARNEAALIQVAAEYRWPTIFVEPHAARNGGLIGYGEDSEAHSRRQARMVARVLDGAKPADLPIERPTTFKLVINLKTAKLLGLKIPPLFLLRADEVIE
jgi:ABC-type uncharacterized transport system substrate-binding protein